MKKCLGSEGTIGEPRFPTPLLWGEQHELQRTVVQHSVQSEGSGLASATPLTVRAFFSFE